MNWSPFRSPAGIAAASPLAVRRGITPTSHLMREKPPTPPPVRDRSRSPAVQNQQNQNLKQRMLSSSVPPQVINDKQQQQQNQHDQTPAVNPNLYAIRQAMYRKERERLGISENEKTTNPYAPTTPVKIETRRGNPEQVVDECGSAAGSIASTMTVFFNYWNF